MMTSRWRAPVALVVLAALFACLKGRSPTDASASAVRFSLKAQVTGGSVLHVTVVYLDQSSTTDAAPIPVLLLDQRLTVAAGSQDLPLTIDLTRCLADPQHISGSTCELLAGVVLEQNGQEVDSVGIGPISVTPGQTVHDSTSLVAVGKVVVFPKTVSLTVGAIAVLQDSVYSPTGAYIANATVRWSSADSTIAKVNQNGAVTGVAAGQTTVTASAGGQSDSATITVSTLGGAGTIVINAPRGISFTAPTGGGIPGNGAVSVTSSDTVTLTGLTTNIAYTAGQPGGWLLANVSDSSQLLGQRVSGSRVRRQAAGPSIVTPAVLDAVPTTTSLPAGTYTATLTVSGTNANPGSVTVTYTVTAAAPALGFSPTQEFFNQYAYGSATATEQTVFALNTGTGGAIGTISQSGGITYTGPDTGWLTAAVGPDTVALQPKTTALKLGTDTARMRFTASGTTNTDTLVVTLSTFVTYQKVVLGAGFGCGLTTASTVYCWGGDGAGELGDGGADQSVTTPVRAQLPYSPTNPVIDIEAGSAHVCALLQNGTVYCWGNNNRGQVGVGSGATTIPIPTAITGRTYGQISLGANHTCAIEGTPPLAGPGYVDCWGDNTDGEFGNNLPTGTAQTTPLNTANMFYSVSAGNNYTCGINNKTNGTLYCWGQDQSGQLGNGYSGTFYTTPQQVTLAITAGPPPVPASVSAGNQTTCATDVAGNGYCWGDNTFGEVGNGTTSLTPVTFPTAITGSYNWTSISAGFTSVCGIASTGQLCWGDANLGQLGNGTQGPGSGTPSQVTGGGGSVLFTEFIVGEGSQSACYITSGAVSCFGDDSNGQLGTGSPVTSAVPNPVLMTAQPAPSGVSPSRVIRRPTLKVRPPARK